MMIISSIKKFGELAKYLIDSNIVKKFHVPKECSIETLKSSHSIEYINHIKNKTLDIKLKKIGFPINDSVVKRSFVATGGTVLASKLALDTKLACNTAGGSHLCYFFNCGAGYCVFNDVAVAANYLKSKGYAKKIL